jgi:hypothetical protein
MHPFRKHKISKLESEAESQGRINNCNIVLTKMQTEMPEKGKFVKFYKVLCRY